MSNKYYPSIPQTTQTQPQIVYVQNSSMIIRIATKFISGIILYLVISYVFSYIYHKFITQSMNPLDVWYSKYGKQYVSKFDIRNIYLYQNEPKWKYELGNLFSSSKSLDDIPINKLYDFLLTYVEPHLYRLEPGKKFNSGRNFILPRHLVEGIQFISNDNDADYETWLGKRKINTKNNPKDPEVVSMNTNNPLQWTASDSEWRNRIAYWCGARTNSEISSFWTRDGVNSQKYVVNVGLTGSKTPSLISFEKANEKWNEVMEDGKTLVNADNVFARYGFNYDCPAISYLANKDVSGTSSSEMNKRGAVLKLLGLDRTGRPLNKNVVGGWIGYFKEFTDSSSPGPLDILYNQEDSSNVASHPYTTPCPKVTKRDASSLFSGILNTVAGAGLIIGGLLTGTGEATIPMALPMVVGGAGSLFGYADGGKKVCKKDA